MMEVAFSCSMGGALKLAQRYGEGPFAEDGPTAVSAAAGESEHERAAAQERVRQAERRAWEQATPLGGREEDVFSLPLGLSVGDISEDIPGSARREALSLLLGDGREADAALEESLRSLREILRRSAAGEGIRIWYSDEPDEMSGLYWLLFQIGALDGGQGPVSIVRLPRFEQDVVQQGAHGTSVERLILRSGWGDVAPGEIARFLTLEVPVSSLLIRAVAERWRQLQMENAPLRGVLNGTLVSLPEVAYDGFILRELAEMDEEFNEAVLIGNVLARRRLGIGDALIARRVQTLVDDGVLAVAAPAADPEALYGRTLRKLAPGGRTGTGGDGQCS